MNKSARISPLFILVAALLIAGIAATPATLAQPDGPSVQATSNGGEIVISWDRVSGAQYYTVGWVNWTKGKPVSDAGGDWLSLFHYTTVLGSETNYTVKGLEEGKDHYAIIRATDVGGAGRFGGGYSQWSMELHIPKLREGSYFPSLLEPRRRSEKALLSVIQQSYTELHINRRRVHPPGGRSDQGPGLRHHLYPPTRRWQTPP